MFNHMIYRFGGLIIIDVELIKTVLWINKEILVAAFCLGCVLTAAIIFKGK